MNNTLGLYLILQLDNFRDGFVCLLLAGGLLGMVASLERGRLAQALGLPLFGAKFAAAVCMVIGFSGVLLCPTTKTACVLYVVPKVLASEQITSDAKDVYNLGIQHVKELLTK